MTFPLKDNSRFSRLPAATALVSALLLALTVAACLEKEEAPNLVYVDRVPATITLGEGSVTDGATGVDRFPTFVYSFSELMNTSSVEGAFSVAPADGGEAVTSEGFEITWTGEELVTLVKTGAPLASLTAYAATLDTSTADAGGATLAEPYTLSFTTADYTPSVNSISPTDGATGIDRATAIVVAFSRAMDTASVESAFSLGDGTVDVSGTFAWNGDDTEVTFTPDAVLTSYTDHTLTIASSATEPLGATMAADYSTSFTTADYAPSVNSISPSDGATGIDRASSIGVTFSRAMDTASVESAFSLSEGSTEVIGTFGWNADETEVTFTPTGSLASYASHTTTIAATAAESLGTTLAAAFSASFTTADYAPSVNSISPSDGATGIDRATAIVVTFSRAMDTASVERAFALNDGTADVTGTFGWNAEETEVTFTPTDALASYASHTTTIAETAAESLGATLTADYSASFNTADYAPSVNSFSPSDGASGIDWATAIVVTFSRAMDTASVESAFNLSDGTADVTGTFGWNADATEVTFSPSALLASETLHSVSISASASEALGTTMATDFTSSFTSGTSIYTDSTTGMEFVMVPGGSFEMGCGAWTSSCFSDESPVRTVTLDSFMLGKYEVTQGEWAAVMGSNPSAFQLGDNYPVERVSWDDVQSFITALNAISSVIYRLPTEAEWEYACRSGGEEVMYGTSGDAMTSSDANYIISGIGQTVAVGSYSPNALGLYDMSGNVWDWIQDIYTSSYDIVGTDNPVYEGSGALRVKRGGSWPYSAQVLRCSDRRNGDPSGSASYVGFRLLRAP